MFCSHTRSQPACFSGRTSGACVAWPDLSAALKLAARAAAATEQQAPSGSTLAGFRGRIHDFDRSPSSREGPPTDRGSDEASEEAQGRKGPRNAARARQKQRRQSPLGKAPLQGVGLPRLKAPERRFGDSLSLDQILVVSFLLLC